MHVSVITAFPEFFRDFLSVSIVGRAVKSGLINVDVVDLRTFCRGAYRQVDDYAFGSGGMVLMPEPLSEALASVHDPVPFVLYPTPQGVPLTQETVESLYHQEHLVVICGHYEGIDERFVERSVDLEFSVGDCVLTGGEIPAMTVIDAVARLVPGVVGRIEAVEDDSFYRGMLDHPHYTRPALWEGREVPSVLLSGDAAAIDDWRRSQAVERTLRRRPDLLSRADIGQYIGPLYVCLLCQPADSVDVRDVLAVRDICLAYGVERVIFAIPNREERTSLKDALINEQGSEKVKLMPSSDHVRNWLSGKKQDPLSVGLSDVAVSGARHWLDVKRTLLQKRKPVVIYSAWNGDMSESELRACDVVMTPVRDSRSGVSLPQCGKIAVVLDRFL